MIRTGRHLNFAANLSNKPGPPQSSKHTNAKVGVGARRSAREAWHNCYRTSAAMLCAIRSAVSWSESCARWA